MIAPELAAKLQALPEWQALQEHVAEAIVVMDSCSTIPDGEDHDKVARGRKEAVRILKQILSPFGLEVEPGPDLRKVALRKLGMEA